MEGKGRKRKMEKKSGYLELETSTLERNTERRLEVADDRSVHSGPGPCFLTPRFRGARERGVIGERLGRRDLPQLPQPGLAVKQRTEAVTACP